MGHRISGILGRREDVCRIAEQLIHADLIELPQGFGMILMTDKLLRDVEELAEVSDKIVFPGLDRFTEAVRELMERYSFHTKLAYIETDYFGGAGTQGGLLYENGCAAVDPSAAETGVINALLSELGVRRESGKDEFDSLGLGNYRRMP